MRRYLIAGVAVALVLSGLVIAVLGPRNCPVNRAAFERVREQRTKRQRVGNDMMLGDVEAVLGMPPGDYRTRPHASEQRRSGAAREPLCDVNEVSEWVGDDGAIVVYHLCECTIGEAVLGVQFEDAMPYSPGLIELARWRLEKLKESMFP